MEDPNYWNRLIASLAVVGLKDADTAWAFVRDEGLVRDGPGHVEQFREAAHEMLANDITGPSPAARLAARLQNLGIVVKEKAAEPDPSGQKAKVRLQQWRARARS